MNHADSLSHSYRQSESRTSIAAFTILKDVNTAVVKILTHTMMNNLDIILSLYDCSLDYK